MDKRNFSNIGEDIKNIVQDAVNTGDFHQLSRDIGNTVNSALDEARNSIRWTQDSRKRMNGEAGFNSWRNNNPGGNGFSQKKNTADQNRASNAYNNQNRYYNNTKNQSQTNNTQLRNRYANTPKITNTVVPVGKVAGILCTVFGNIGVGVLGLGTIVLMVVGHLLGLDEFYATIVLGILPLLLISVLVLARGNKIRRRLRRMQQYVTKMSGRNYCLIKDLQASTGLSSRFLVKDLQKMIAIGMFPQGHIDENKTSFMLDNESYKLYMDLQDNIKKVKLEEQQKQEFLKKEDEKKQEGLKREEERRQEAIKNAGGTDKEVRGILEEGRRYIHQIKDANHAIPGEEVSRKLDRLEDVTGKIFDYVELHPDQIPEIRKFMEYYLPTTLKLLEAYKEFDRQPVQGENITTAKKEIEKTLDTINLAFENLLDDLFEDAAMDVSTDISVLNTMLAQEGLTENNLKSFSK